MSQPPPGFAPGYRTVAYFVNWAVYGRKHFPADLPAEKLTHILYAFANVNGETGEVKLTDSWADVEQHYPGDSWNDVGTNMYGALKQLFLLKKRNRNLKVLLSIGGWTYSPNFRGCLTPQGRVNFAKTSVEILKEYGFDGLDIDWEYPKDLGETDALIQTLKAVRSELSAYSSSLPNNPHFLLTIASPAGPQNYLHMKMGELSKYLDFINLMAYDFAGSWDSVAGHQSNLFDSQTNCTPFSTQKAITDYVNDGVPPWKIVLGMPLYGRAFKNTNGPGTGFQGVGEPDQDHGSWEGGVWEYKALPRPGAQEQFDPQIGASWSYDASSHTMITYDTKISANQKVDFIHRNQLGGAMWWESSGDKAGPDSLIDLVWCGLKSQGPGIEQWQNELNYPQSKYDNLKKSFPGEGEN